MKEVKRYSGVIVKCGDEVLLCKRNTTGTLPGQYTLDDDLKLVGFVKRYNRDGSEVKGLMYVFMMETNEPINPDLENAIDGDEHSMCSYFNLENLPFDDKDDQLCRLITRILKKD